MPTRCSIVPRAELEPAVVLSAEGLTAQPMFGEGAQVNLVELAPGAVVPVDSHPPSSAASACAARDPLIPGEVHRIGPMDAYDIPGRC